MMAGSPKARTTVVVDPLLLVILVTAVVPTSVDTGTPEISD